MKPFCIAASLAALASGLAACGSQAPANERSPDTASLSARARAPATTEPTRLTFTEACDGSAAVALEGGRIAIGHDDDNYLRIYGKGGGAPLWSSELFGSGKEVDVEGAARIGDTIYWIGSHGTKKDGGAAPKRRALIATRIVGDGLELVGEPYRRLIEDLGAAAATKGYDLPAAALRAPETENALNIEGLAATPEGRLLIGFRNPQPGGKALVVELLNPAGVVAGERAKIGARHQLKLGQGMGLRDIAWSPEERSYLIIAGPFSATGPFALFRWDGRNSDPQPSRLAMPAGFGPEALVRLENGSLLLLGNDGDENLGDVICKDKEPEKDRRFGALVFPPDAGD